MGSCVAKPESLVEEKSAVGHLEPRSKVSFDETPTVIPAMDETVKTPEKQINGHLPHISPRQSSPRSSSPKKKQFQRSSSTGRDKAELRRSAEFWDDGDRLGRIPTQDIVASYRKDNALILRSLSRLEQAFLDHAASQTPRDLEKQSSNSAFARVSNSVPVEEEASEPEQGTSDTIRMATQMSEALSLCNEEGLLPGFPNKSLRVLLSADPLLNSARESYEDSKMLTARKQLRQWCKRHAVQLDDMIPYSKTMGLDVKDLLRHCDIIEQAVEAHANEDGYSKAFDDGELRVLYKQKGKKHHVKMEATLPVPLEQPLSLAREFDLMKTWNHYMVDSELLYAPSIWESWVYAAMWMPFPFPQMECMGRGRGFDLSEEHKCLLIPVESKEAEDLPAGANEIPHSKKKRHRAEIMPGSAIRLEPLPPQHGESARTKGSILIIVDPHVPHVPAFIVNFILRVMAPFAHKQIKKLMQTEFDDPTKPFPKRIADRPDLYERARQQVKLGLSKHYGIDASEKAIGLA